MTGEAAVIEPVGLIRGKPGRQDFALPGAGRSLEAFELRHDGLERLWPFHPRLCRDALPDREKAKEVAGGNRLDLGAQALDCVLMNSREQPALAPFFRGSLGGEPAAQRKAFGFQRGKGGEDVSWRQPQRTRKCVGPRGPLPLQAAADDLDEGFVPRPRACGRRRGRRDQRIELSRGPYGLKLRQPLGSDPERGMRHIQPGHSFLSCKTPTGNRSNRNSPALPRH